MFDAQGWYARDVIMGKISLPSKDEMLKNNQEWKDREEKLETDEDMIWFQGDYTKELIEATDYPTFDIEAVKKHSWNGNTINMTISWVIETILISL